MSTILKALKKLEEEQRAAAQQPLARQILADRGPGVRPLRHRSLVAAGAAGGLLVALLVMIAVYWLPERGPTASVPADPATTRPAIANSAAPAAGSVPAPAAGLPMADPAPPVPAKPVTGPAQPVAPAAGPVGSKGEGGPAGKVEESVGETVLTSPRIPPAGREGSAPHLVVSDILPGSGAGGRMAVVNGLPVMEGTRIDNALVKEIRADRVLFAIDGRNVTVEVRAGQ
jgi:hypothetical protein